MTTRLGSQSLLSPEDLWDRAEKGTLRSPRPPPPQAPSPPRVDRPHHLLPESPAAYAVPSEEPTDLVRSHAQALRAATTHHGLYPPDLHSSSPRDAPVSTPAPSHLPEAAPRPVLPAAPSKASLRHAAVTQLLRPQDLVVRTGREPVGEQGGRGDGGRRQAEERQGQGREHEMSPRRDVAARKAALPTL